MMYYYLINILPSRNNNSRATTLLYLIKFCTMEQGNEGDAIILLALRQIEWYVSIYLNVEAF